MAARAPTRAAARASASTAGRGRVRAPAACVAAGGADGGNSEGLRGKIEWSALPEVGVGTIAWGDDSYGFGNAFREPDVRAAFDAARDAGIAFFDTAEVYGYKSGKYEQSAEHLLGHFCNEAAQGAGDGSDGVFVGSKVFTIPWTNAIMGGGFRTGREQLVAACRDSVARLGGRQLDLWSIHFPFPTFKQAVLMDALEEAMDLGLVKAVGVSNYDAGQLEEAHELLERRGIQLSSNQVKYSLLAREPESSGLLLKCAERGVKLVAYSPLDGGKLAKGDTASDAKVSGCAIARCSARTRVGRHCR